MPKLEISKVHDAYVQPGECPLCGLLSAAEETYLRSFTHSRVMEPNVRVQTNEHGFCPVHYRMLYEGENKLGLALMVHTHLASKLPGLLAAIDEVARPSARGRDRRQEARREKAMEDLSRQRDSCFLCGLLAADLDRYCFTILYLWAKDPEFPPVYSASRGFCIPHFVSMSAAARRLLRPDRRDAWMAETASLESSSLKRLEGEVLGFTELHKASHAGPGVGDERTALARALGKLAGGVFSLD